MAGGFAGGGAWNYRRAMARTDSFFSTQIYRAVLPKVRNEELARACLVLARDDIAGQRWARAHGATGSAGALAI